MLGSAALGWVTDCGGWGGGGLWDSPVSWGQRPIGE